MQCDVESLITPKPTIKVSSTLNNSVKRHNILDGSSETCWTSGQGTPQYVQLDFLSPVVPKRISLTFQGGFVGTHCSVDVCNIAEDGHSMEWHTLTHIYPENVNKQQSFELKGEEDVQKLVENGVQSIKLVFKRSSDLFGRITVYDLNVEGSVL